MQPCPHGIRIITKHITGAIKQKIIKSLGQNPAVAILGPRQIGKTTLAEGVGLS